MDEDITVEIGGVYGESLECKDQSIRFVDIGAWVCPVSKSQ